MTRAAPVSARQRRECHQLIARNTFKRPMLCSSHQPVTQVRRAKRRATSGNEVSPPKKPNMAGNSSAQMQPLPSRSNLASTLPTYLRRTMLCQARKYRESVNLDNEEEPCYHLDHGEKDTWQNVSHRTFRASVKPRSVCGMGNAYSSPASMRISRSICLISAAFILRVLSRS